MSLRRSDSSARLKLAIIPGFWASCAHASARLNPPDSATTFSTCGRLINSSKVPGTAGIDSLSMTCWPSPSPSSAARIAAWSNPSLAARSALLMFTSGSMIGISPCASTCFATSNCCATIASIPAGLAALITERSLVPKTPSPLARPSSAPSPGIGFII